MTFPGGSPSAVSGATREGSGAKGELTLGELHRMFAEPRGDRASAAPPSPQWEALEADLFREVQRLWHEAPHRTDTELERASQSAETKSSTRA